MKVCFSVGRKEAVMGGLLVAEIHVAGVGEGITEAEDGRAGRGCHD